jgi:hypothetical protein
MISSTTTWSIWIKSFKQALSLTTSTWFDLRSFHNWGTQNNC